ncbi:MAG: plastocyanin/azurin family copper-binding protein [Rhodanobacteraceae bacterium]
MRAIVHGIGVAVLSLVAIRSQAADHEVTVGSNSISFDPQLVTINTGDTVTFVSETAMSHNVHANDDSFRCADGCDGDGHGGNGGPRPGPWRATVRFDHAGTFGYRCDPHAPYGMVGAVQVVDGGGGGSGGGTFVPITSGFTGAWYDPAQSGHGLFLEVLEGNRMLAWWFTFNPEGTGQTWFGNVGTIDGDTATVAAVQTEGGRWIPNFDPDNVTQPSWGTLTFHFTDCSHGEVDFVSTVPGYGSGHMDLTRLTQPAGLACP